MINVLKLELKSCMKRKEIHFVLSFLILLSVAAFIAESIPFYESNMRFIRSAYETTILQGVYANPFRNTLLFIIPLVAATVFSDSFFIDYRMGVYKNILTRSDKKTYLIAKYIVTFIMTFMVFFIGLLINQLLCFITFPLNGFDNNSSLPPYDIGLQNFNNKALFDLLRLESPLFYNLTFIFIISLFAGLISLVTYSVYFLCLNKNRIIGIMSIFIIYIVINIGLPILGLNEFSLFNQLNPGHEGNFIQMIVWIVVLLFISFYILITKGIKSEWELED
ncbi:MULTISPECIES: hypothetical protein [Priestia]|uniref:hypothetical protein n=1 Tax=Priestia TaxID=2800373 RepID=UPI00064FF089|nr:hypothetical protein [Priestia aryabhattai]KML23304.1 hypothetical protein VL11_27045 [Priestia aryabhattai]KMN98937.1 hypothetical protein ABV89_14710 [Priestia aryabhattai]